MKALSNIVVCVLLSLFSHSVNAQRTASSIADTIISRTGCPPLTNTVDTFRAGDPEAKVSGIVVCMFPTMEVLKRAVEMNCNMIIAHEPLYYNGTDDTRMLLSDPVYLEKQRYIDDNGLIIWRFHDYIHRMKPDGIITGMVRKLGWTSNVKGEETNLIVLPETTLAELLHYLHARFKGVAFDVVGDPEMVLTGVAFSAGASGSRQHLTMLQEPDINVVIAGEVPQWETYEYVRDAVSQGRGKALILLGHIPSEEAGMEYAAEWINGFINEIPVSFVESGPSYWTSAGGEK